MCKGLTIDMSDRYLTSMEYTCILTCLTRYGSNPSMGGTSPDSQNIPVHRDFLINEEKAFCEC